MLGQLEKRDGATDTAIAKFLQAITK